MIENQSNDLISIKDYIPNEADIGRRVLCLYRVSSDKQVTYDSKGDADIPMQRRECRRFLERQGWVLVHEEREDGISGHKVRAEKRDAIQYIKELAIAKKFDIILVFMFDRIGRIADETPFVVEWLAKNGVRVWSTQEGEQRFDNHTDKLMNYIRFWQADGESEKTSIRTKTSLGQLVEDGHYKGGNAPYGYMLVKSGRLDKKKNEKKNLAINEDEAVVVRKIYDLYVNHGYGVHKITNILVNEGIMARTGKSFHHATVNGIIRNLTYTGILRSGDSRSPIVEALQIISPVMWQKAQDILKKRSADYTEARPYPKNISSNCLLNGKLYCADCGSRLTVTSNGKYTQVNGKTVKRLRYQCYGKTRKQTDCHGQTGYTAARLDGIVDGIIRYIFEYMRSIPKSEVVGAGLAVMRHELETRHNAARQDYEKAASDLAQLKAEVIKAIRGESQFTPELLNELIASSETSLAALQTVLTNTKQDLDECKNRTAKIQAQYDEVITWTELYDGADLQAKKMIVANLINRIEVGTDYAVHIDFKINLSHYNIQLENCA